jgi:DNA-binding MarR family transcriptional regulator
MCGRFRRLDTSLLAQCAAPHIVSSVKDVAAAETAELARTELARTELAKTERAKSEAAELLAAIGVMRRATRHAARATDAAALPPARSELLRLAARRPGIGVAEAAQELRLAPNSVSTMVSKLKEDGLLSRGRGELDGRSVRLSVTEAGAARVEQWRDIRADLAGRALERLPLADQQTLRAAAPALIRLGQQLEAL